MVPWFPGGHADPWNHVEAAMALDLGGARAEAERAYEWLVDLQRPDGVWHQYYLDGSVEQDKLDANVCAYIAAGVWHHWLLTGDRGFAETMWPVVEKAIDFVLDLQTPRGEILWARHADGTPWSFALLTGSSSICHSLRCAIAIAELLGHERPDWELSAARLADVIAPPSPRPSRPSTAGRWTGTTRSSAASSSASAGAGPPRRALRHVRHGRQGRALRRRPPVDHRRRDVRVRRSPTSPSASARRPSDLFCWTQQFRHDDGRYWTGTVFPDEARFPGGERSTYTAASVILGADALAGASPASGALHRPRPRAPHADRHVRVRVRQRSRLARVLAPEAWPAASLLYLFGGAMLPQPTFGFERLVTSNHKVALPCRGGTVVLGPFERYVFAWTLWQLAARGAVELAIDPNARPPRRRSILPLFLNLTMQRGAGELVSDGGARRAARRRLPGRARSRRPRGHRVGAAQGRRAKDLVFLPLEAIVDLVHRDTCVHLGIEPAAPARTTIDCASVRPLRQRFQALRADWELFSATDPDVATALLDGAGSGVGYLRPVPTRNIHI